MDETLSIHQPDFDVIRRFSADIRIETVRAIGEAGFGHIGGAASIADVLAVLYGVVMRIDPGKPDWEERDWFVLSKGHGGPALYATLALKGYFPMEWLKTINAPDTRLPSHADRLRTPGVDMTTGSLGQGMSSAIGIAMGNRLQGRQNYTYCILGDGELNEGQVWEGCETAASQKLDRFIVFVDWNKKQLDGWIKDICDPLNIEGKFRAFGFDARTVKGYDVKEIYEAIQAAKTVQDKPHAVILDTIKGLGIKLAEEQEFNHYLTFGPKEAQASIDEIEKRYKNRTYPEGDFKW
jgi:transketolase